MFTRPPPPPRTRTTGVSPRLAPGASLRRSEPLARFVLEAHPGLPSRRSGFHLRPHHLHPFLDGRLVAFDGLPRAGPAPTSRCGATAPTSRTGCTTPRTGVRSQSRSGPGSTAGRHPNRGRPVPDAAHCPDGRTARRSDGAATQVPWTATPRSRRRARCCATSRPAAPSPAEPGPPARSTRLARTGPRPASSPTPASAAQRESTHHPVHTSYTLKQRTVDPPTGTKGPPGTAIPTAVLL